MLKQLDIHNIAIIERVRLSFESGLTVFTGESGSGKSILLDAIALVFGEKASPKEILRQGCSRGMVELTVDIGQGTRSPTLGHLLAEQGITLEAGETELLLSREFTPTGSRSRINGIPVTREVLTQLRPLVLDLHGQHELTDLFQNDKQRAYLDAFGGKDLLALKLQVQAAYESWQSDYQQLKALEETRQQRERELDFLRFQFEELEKARLGEPDEDSRIRQELDVLGHSEKLIRLCGETTDILQSSHEGAPTITDLLGRAEKRLGEAASYDTKLEPLLNTLQSVTEELKHVSAELHQYTEGIQYQPEQIADAGERLDLLEKLKRKYGPTLADVLQAYDTIAHQLARYEDCEQQSGQLEAQCREKEAILKTLCERLNHERLALASALKAALVEQLEGLGMPSVAFDIQFNTRPYGPEGTDDITFQFSANPGEPLRALAKVASGGELSRFLLALKVLTAGNAGARTLVFDEIDTGISGKTARIVAQKLSGLAQRLQVLVITHQPMIAAVAEHHWHVEKRLIENETITVTATSLRTEESRLGILSRLVSGTDESDETVENFIRQLRAQAVPDAFTA